MAAAVIGASVGSFPATNRRADQLIIRTRLNMIPPASGGPQPKVTAEIADGRATAELVQAIKAFQNRHVEPRFRDGRIDPGGRTLRKINELTANATPGVLPSPGVLPNPGPAMPDVTKVTVGHTIVPLKQQSGYACWATVGTMIAKGRNAGLHARINGLTIDQQIRTVLDEMPNKQAWLKRYEANTGLEIANHNLFFVGALKLTEQVTALNLNNKPFLVHRGIFAWYSLMRTTGMPLVVNVARLNAQHQQRSHVVILVGVDLVTHMPNKWAPAGLPSGTITYVDPGSGTKTTMSGEDIDSLVGPIADWDNEEMNFRARLWW
jgi:hypothetical protein